MKNAKLMLMRSGFEAHSPFLFRVFENSSVHSKSVMRSKKKKVLQVLLTY
jgi:hypothetical protein